MSYPEGYIHHELAIALVGPLPPPSGGMANQTQQLARLLTEEGLRVEMVQVNLPYKPGWIGRIPMLRAGFRLLPYLRTLWRVLGQVDLVHVMANSGWSWHLFTAPVIWIGWLRHKPVVVNYRGGGAEKFFSRSFYWVRPTLNRARAIIVPSSFLAGVFEKYNFNVEIVPNVIDLTRFSPSPCSLRENGPCVMVARNLEQIYDIATAIRAFALLKQQFPQARMSVAGSGPLRAELENLAARLGLNEAVYFTGRLDNNQMAALYHKADLMLNPSTVDNMPISILEALASGVPVVSTNVGGIPLLVEDGLHALLVPPQNPEAMASAAIRLLESPNLAKRLRMAGLELVKHYAWSSVHKRLFEVYSRLLFNSLG